MMVLQVPVLTTQKDEEGWINVSARLEIHKNYFLYHAEGVYRQEDRLLGFVEGKSETIWITGMNPATDDIKLSVDPSGEWNLDHNGQSVANSISREEVEQVYQVVRQKIWGS